LGIKNYTDTEQVCNIESSVPIGITESDRKMRCIFSKIQYSNKGDKEGGVTGKMEDGGWRN